MLDTSLGNLRNVCHMGALTLEQKNLISQRLERRASDDPKQCHKPLHAYQTHLIYGTS